MFELTVEIWISSTRRWHRKPWDWVESWHIEKRADKEDLRNSKVKSMVLCEEENMGFGVGSTGRVSLGFLIISFFESSLLISPWKDIFFFFSNLPFCLFFIVSISPQIPPLHVHIVCLFHKIL